MLEGGLDYKINVGGNWREEIAQFQSQVDGLKKQAAVSRTRTTSTKETTSQAGAEGQVNSLLKEQQKLERQIKSLRSSTLITLRAQKDLYSKISKELGAVTTKEGKRLQQIKARENFEKQQIRSAQRRNRELTKAADLQRKATSDELKNDIIARSQKAEKATAKAQKDELRTQKELRKLDAQRVKDMDRAEAAAERQRLQTDANAIAHRRMVKNQREVQAAQIAIAKYSKTHGVSARQAAEELGISARIARQLKINMFDVQHAARMFLFTFRRLVGILAVFTLARKFAQAIGQAVREMSRFNAELETARNGIAGIIASVGQVYDVQGNLVKGAEAFQQALLAADATIRQLKQDAVGSLATFEALVQTYQVAVGPGLAAGLDLNQIREVSKRLAEGAVTLGVPLNQLSEEIRSLLQGTATARNTRIAVLFGGAQQANEAIRLAKQQGNLYEVLTEKLKGVEQASEAASQSFNVLKSDLQDSVQLLLSGGGIEYFDQLKDTLKGVRSALVEVRNDGGVVLRPEAVQVVQQVSVALATLIDNFRRFTSTNSGLNFLENTFGALRGAISSLLPLVTTFFSGIVAGVNLVLGPLSRFLQALGDINQYLSKTFLGKAFLGILKSVVAVTVGFALWRKLLLQIGILAGAKGILGTFKTVQTVVGVVLLNIKALNGQFTFTNILAAVLNRQMDALAIKSAVISGGVTLLAGILIYVVARLTVMRKLSGDISDETGDITKEMEEALKNITASTDSMAEGAKSAAEWADEIRKLKQELLSVEGLRFLTGDAKEFAEILHEALADINEGTYQFEEQRKASLERKKNLEAELNALKLRNELLDSATTLEELYNEIPDITQKEVEDFLKRVGPASVFDDPQTDLEKYLNTLDEGYDIKEQIRIKTREQAELEKKIEDYTKKTVEVLELKAQIYQKNKPFLIQELELSEGYVESQLRALEAVEGQVRESARRVTQARLERDLYAVQVQKAQEARKIAIESLQTNVDLANSLKDQGVSSETITEHTRQLNSAQAEHRFLLEEEQHTLEAMTAEYEKQKKLVEGDVKTAITAGFSDFYNELPALGEAMADIISQSLTDLASTVGSVFKDAIDPRKDADLRTAFGEFFLNMAGQMAEAIVAETLAAGIAKLGIETATDAATEAATDTVLATTLTTAMAAQTTATTTAMAAQTTALTTVLTTQTATLLPVLSTIAANTAATAIATATDAAVPLAKGGLVEAFKRGGRVQAFASGGKADALPRPPHIPASDTVPAWLTPGEYVVRREAVRKYGVGILEAINRGMLNPHSFGHAAFALGGLARGVQGFAAGGGVRKTASSNNGPGGSRETVVLPVMPANDNTLEQMLTGGKKTFEKGVNKINIVGDPNKSGRWR